MELWVRAQDRETLLKVENFSIDNENYILGNLISDDNKSICDYWRLGHYKTKERCLQILDEIQNILKPSIIMQEVEGVITTNDNSMHIINPTYGEIKPLGVYVYEMPLD